MAIKIGIKGQNVITVIGTFSLLNVYEAKQWDSGDSNYNGHLIIDPSKKKNKAFLEEVEQLIEETFEAYKKKKGLSASKKLEDTFLKDGNDFLESFEDEEKRANFEKTYEDMVFISAKSNYAPNILNTKNKISESIDDEDNIMSGDKGEFKIKVVATNAGKKYYVSAYLDTLKKTETGEERFGGNALNVDEFGGVEEEEEEDEF